MSREDVLDAFCVEPDNGPATLVRYLRDYPEYAADLTQLSQEMSKPLPEKTGPLSEADKSLINKSWDQFQSKIQSIKIQGHPLESRSISSIKIDPNTCETELGAETAAHWNKLAEALNWFYSQGVTVSVTPTADGFSLKLINREVA